MEKIELRFIDGAELTSTDDGLKVSGYVNKTNQWSQELGMRKRFVERILPGTFNRALQSGNEVHFYAEHDPSKILASTRNSSLNLREDDNGLFMEATIAPTSWGKDYHTLIKEGIIQNMSFGMKVLKDSWKKLDSGLYERSISDLYLAEVSAVRNPAYVQSTIAARSIEVVEDVEIPGEEPQDEIREESNQMELEMRDKLADVLDRILVHLEQGAAPKIEPIVEAEPVIEPVKEETPKTEEPAPVVEKEEPKVEEVPAAEPVKEEKPAEEPAKEEPKVEEPAKEEPAPEPEKAPDLSEFYKKLLDLA